MTLGEWCAMNGVELCDLAEQVGITRQTLYRIRARRLVPRLDVALRIATLTLGAVQPHELMPEAWTPDQPVHRWRKAWVDGEPGDGT